MRVFVILFFCERSTRSAVILVFSHKISYCKYHAKALFLKLYFIKTSLLQLQFCCNFYFKEIIHLKKYEATKLCLYPMARSCDKSRPWSKTAVLAQDPKSDPASILSPALVSNGRLGKEKKKTHLQRFLLWGASWSKKRYADRQGFRKGAKGVIRFTINIFTHVMSCGASGHWAGTHLCTLTAANTTFPSSKYTKVKKSHQSIWHWGQQYKNRKRNENWEVMVSKPEEHTCLPG